MFDLNEQIRSMSADELTRLRDAIDKELTRRKNEAGGLRVGDKVTHKKGDITGVGVVAGFSKSGKRARVRTQGLFGYSNTYYDIGLLDKV